jgi:hypothetical protein
MSRDKSKQSIKQRDPDLANAEVTMKRAAVKAREIAKATHTAVVFLEDDVIKEEYPEQNTSSE